LGESGSSEWSGDMARVLCQRYGLALVAVSAQGSDRSALVAHVHDQEGRHFVLKRTTPERGPSEIAALRAWSNTGCAARLVAVLEDDLYLADWLIGPSLAETSVWEDRDVVAAGRMIAGLHAALLPADLPDICNRFTLSSDRDWSLLPAGMRALGVRVNARLCAGAATHSALLHGDLVPGNVILSPSGPQAIDPFGYAGLPSWDLAQLAVATEGRSRRRLLPALLTGYGSIPPLLADAFSWMILFFLHKNVADHRTEFRANLQPLAERLITVNDPDAFLDQYCKT